MASKGINRVVDTEVPVAGSSQEKELQAIEKRYTLDQAVALFREERKKSDLLGKVCIEAETFLSSGQVGKNLGNLSSLNTYSKVAIVAFTLESPKKIYEEFNSQSRNLTSSSWNSFPYKGMWLLLNKAILSHGTQPSSLTVYRNIMALVNASSTYSFGLVASAMLDPNKLQGLSTGQRTLFAIKGSRCLNIKALSAFPEEDEYILPAFDTFTVTKVENVGSCRPIYLQA